MGFFNSKPEQVLPAFTYQNMIKHIIEHKMEDNYQTIDLLGRGSYAEVRKAKSKRTGQLRAIKTIDRIKNAKIQPLLLNQFDILKQMDHPNILKIYEIYEENRFYHIVTQLCEGKELFEVLRERKYFGEIEAVKIFWQLASSVQYLHSKGIMHRDLKPENIMYDQKNNRVKLIDFGSALRYQSEEVMQTRRVGTSYYIAPEVIARCYNNKCDIWSLGIILYVLLSGEPPFKGKTDEEVLDSIANGQYNFYKPTWENVSSQAKILITDMLQKNPIKRCSMTAVMSSDWIEKNANILKSEQMSTKSMQKMLSNMQKFKQIKPNKIQGAVLVFMVNFVKSPRDQAQLQRCFKDLDENGDGMLSLQQFTKGLEKYLKTGERQAQVVAKNIFSRVDTNDSGFIDYSQFLVAARGMQIAATKQNLQLAFDVLDQDKNGTVSVEQLRSKLGDNISLQAYQKMIKQSIPNCKGQITRKDFVLMMSKMGNMQIS